MPTVTQNATPTTTTRNRQVRDAAFIGLFLQLVVTALPLLDLAFFGTIESHVRDAYPEWPASDISADRNAIVWGLVIIGAVGLAGWLATAAAAARGRAVRTVVTTLFVGGTCITLYAMTMSGGAYDRVVPLWIGVTTFVLPALAGVTATLAAWRPTE